MTTPTPEVFAYQAIDPCGCVRAATIDDPKHAKEVKRDLAQFLKHAAYIERVPLEKVRVTLCTDKHPKEVCPHPQACPYRAARVEL